MPKQEILFYAQKLSTYLKEYEDIELSAEAIIRYVRNDGIKEKCKRLERIFKKDNGNL